MRKLINEVQMIQLFEERGVALSPFKKELDNIALYISGCIKQYNIKAESRRDDSMPKTLVEIISRI